MKKSILFLLLITLIGVPSNSQDSTRHLTLEEAISASVSNNDAMKLSALDVQISKSKLRQTDALFLPQANFTYSALATNNPLQAFGLKLQQGSIKETDFNPKRLNDPPFTRDFTAKVELQQPLLNPDMHFQRKAVATQVEMYQLITHRTKDHVRFETEKAYLNLQMTYDENKVLNEALATSKVIYKTSKDYYDQGLIQKSDLLNAQLHVLKIETEIEASRSAILNASDILSVLMNDPTGIVYTTDPITWNNMTNEGKIVPDNRPDFQALQKGMDSYDMTIKSTKMSYLPRLNAFASYQLNDKSMIRFNSNTYLAGIQLSWNIFNGNATKHKIAQQLLEKEKLATQQGLQKREAQLQLNQAWRQLSDASFEMKQQRLAVQQASEALRVLQNRYAQGLVKTTDVLMGQTQLSQQKMQHVHAIFNYNLAAMSIQFLTTTK